VGVGFVGDFLNEGAHEVGAEGAVESDGERVDVAGGVPESFDFLGGDHGFATATDGGANDDGELLLFLVEDFLAGDEGGFGIEGVEDGFDHEDVDATVDKSDDLAPVVVLYLVEGDGAEGGVVGVDDVGEGDGEGADGSSRVAFDAGVGADVVAGFAGELGRFIVELVDEVGEFLVVDDFFLEEVG